MSIKQWMESMEFTCHNFRNAWSYINHKEKRIIFGMWEHHYQEETKSGLIYDYNWTTVKGSQLPDMRHSAENLKLIGYQDYNLSIFIQRAKDINTKPIERYNYKELLYPAKLKRIGSQYYAYLN